MRRKSNEMKAEAAIFISGSQQQQKNFVPFQPTSLDDSTLTNYNQSLSKSQTFPAQQDLIKYPPTTSSLSSHSIGSKNTNEDNLGSHQLKSKPIDEESENEDSSTGNENKNSDKNKDNKQANANNNNNQVKFFFS